MRGRAWRRAAAAAAGTAAIIGGSAGAAGATSFVAIGTVGVGTGPTSISPGNIADVPPDDLVTTNAGDGGITFLTNRNDATFAPLTVATGSAPNDSVFVYDQSGSTALWVANRNGGTVTQFPDAPDFSQVLSTPVPGQPSALAAGNFFNDTFGESSDVVVASAATDQVRAATQFSANPPPATVGDQPVALAPIQIANNAGVSSLVTANAGANTVSVLIPVASAGGTFSFAPAKSYPAGSAPSGVAAGDVNGDRIQDIAVSDGGSNTVALLLGQAGGTFAAPVFLTVGTNPSGVVTADFDRSGTVDIATSNRGANSATVLLGNGNGTFDSPVTVRAGTRPTGLTATDLNGDLYPDLAIANGGSNSVTVALNGPAPRFTCSAPRVKGRTTVTGRAYEAGAKSAKATLATYASNSNGKLVRVASRSATATTKPQTVKFAGTSKLVWVVMVTYRFPGGTVRNGSVYLPTT